MNLNSNGILGTTLFHLIVAFLLIFFGFSYPDPPPEEEGILVNFGTDDTGFGEAEPAGDPFQGGEESVIEQTETIEEVTEEVIPETPVSNQDVVQDDLQDYEESPVVENKPTPEEIRQEQLEKQRQEELRKQQEQLEKQRQEELRKQQEEEEKKRQQAEKINKLGENAFGNKGVGNEPGSEGEKEGTGNQGSPNGTPGADNYGDGGGLGDGNYGLGDRKVRGQLPKPLVEGCLVTSRIVVRVQIVVDSDGNVVGSPRVIEATYQDDCIYEAVINAAKQAKFSADPQKHRERGWINYIIEP